ncbi:MAG: GNAT family N-acetyltransferase [Planctomycetota bacterium]
MTRVATVVAMAVWMFVAAACAHELGHVLGAYATGGRITSVELRPWRLGHTLVSPNPHPSVVLWSGFLVGWIAPFATRPAWRTTRWLIGPALRAWAWFSWLAFGSYLALAGGERLTDTGQLVAVGWPVWLLVAIGGGVALVGYWRSRHAWAALNARLSEPSLTWQTTLPTAVFWWAWLAGWCVAQTLVASLLSPGPTSDNLCYVRFGVVLPGILCHPARHGTSLRSRPCPPMTLPMTPTIRLANLDDPRDADAVVFLIDTYSRDPFGNGAPLDASIRQRLASALREHPTTRVFVAFDDASEDGSDNASDGGRPIGLATCFVGFSTFAARQLINVHDLSVVPEARGKGVGRALLRAVEAHAREHGYCKVTLEVVEHNDHARGLYESEGFGQATYAEGGGALFYAKPLG